MKLLNGITLLEAILKVEFLTSILLAALGMALICLAKRITKTVRKTNFVSSNDKVYIAIKVIGLIFVVIAFVILLVTGLSA